MYSVNLLEASLWVSSLIGLFTTCPNACGLNTAPKAPVAPPAQKPSIGPTVGTVEDGYRFKGGNPADSKNWEKVK